MMIKFKLDKVLNEKEMTMYQLSKTTGIRPNTISQWVNNEELEEDKQVKSISVDVLNKVCKALNCDVCDIVRYVENNNENKKK